MKLLFCIFFAFSQSSFGALSFESIQGLNLFSGQNISVEVTKSKQSKLATVVVFLSARCPCSASHEQRLVELANQFQNFQFLGIHSNADESIDESISHFRNAHLPFPIIQDSQNLWADHFGALKTPHVFVLNLYGNIIFQGGIDESRISSHAKKPYLRLALEAIVKGQKPEPEQVRTLGCLIKRY